MPRTIIHKSTNPFHFSYRPDGFSNVYAEYILEHLKNSHTDAFLIIQNDKIVYKYYSKGTSDSSKFLGFSIAKSFVGTLAGIAFEEGYIKSLEDPIINYLPEFRNADSNLQRITIQQLLDMRSGIAIDEIRVGLNAPMSKMYYGKNLNQFMFKLKSANPMAGFRYQNTNTQLLSLIVERATKQPFLSYFEKKLWQKIGTEYNAEWIIDDKENKTAKAYYGLVATAQDFAKLGRLYLNNGNWNGEAVIPTQWIKNTANTDTTLKYKYKNGWWVNNICKDDKDCSFVAEGAYEQYLYVLPEKKLMILRFGNENKNEANDLYELILRLGEVL